MTSSTTIEVGPQDLRTYLARLVEEHPGEVVTVDRPVSSVFERSAVSKALEKHGNPAVVFNHVDGRLQRVAVGLYGSRARLADALDRPVDECVEHVATLDLTRLHPTFVNAGDAPIRHHVAVGEEVDLDTLPIGIHSRGDAGRYITSGVMIVRDPTSGNLNSGIYRLSVTGRNSFTVNAGPGHDLGRIVRSRPEDPIQFALIIGHHPAFVMASQLKHAMTVDAYEAASSLLGETLRVVPGETVDLPIPADAEYVLEGTIGTSDPWVEEGPFGEFTYYAGNAVAPVATVTAVLTRRDPIFVDLHPTHNEHRSLWIFPGREARLLAAVRERVPSVKAVTIPSDGAGLLAIISLDKRHPSDPRSAMMATFGCDDNLKRVIVVDADVDVLEPHEVQWALSVRFQAGRDLLLLPRLKGIRMDPSATRVAVANGVEQVATDKLGMDATTPDPDFPVRADLPPDEFKELDLADYLDESDLGTILTFSEAAARANRI